MKRNKREISEEKGTRVCLLTRHLHKSFDGLSGTFASLIFKILPVGNGGLFFPTVRSLRLSFRFLLCGRVHLLPLLYTGTGLLQFAYPIRSLN